MTARYIKYSFVIIRSKLLDGFVSKAIFKHKFFQKNGIGLIWSFLFFWYFSGVVQGLIYFSGTTGFAGLRSSIFLSFLWLIPLLLFPRYTKLLAAIIGIVLWAASLASLGYFMLYGQEFSQSVIFIMFESNTAEAGEYLTQYFSYTLVFVFIVYSIGAYLLWRKITPVYLSNHLTRWVVSILILVSIFGYPYANRMIKKEEPFAVATEKVLGRMEPVTPWTLVVGYYQYKKQLDNMEALLTHNAALPPLKNLKDENADKPRTIVLVIGESTSRLHMSLYGYGRETNPMLEQLQKTDPGLAVFNDVVASRPYTIEMLQQALTFGDQHNPDAYLTTPSVMNLMKQAGYKTFWITNQQTMTKRNTMLTTFSQMADQQEYLNNNRSQNSEQHDDVLFEPFEKALKDPAPKKFIIVHLLGTHMNYKYRYPDTFKKFRGADPIMPSDLDKKEIAFYNSYDNAVLYNDYVVATLIKTFKDTDPYGFLVFLSDHGEEVYGDKDHEVIGRNEAAPTKGMYTVPFMVWSSPTWQAEHPRDLRALANRPYSSAHLIHTLSDLAGLTYDEYIPARSLVSPQYENETRWIGNPKVKLQSFDALFGNQKQTQDK